MPTSGRRKHRCVSRRWRSKVRSTTENTRKCSNVQELQKSDAYWSHWVIAQATTSPTPTKATKISKMISKIIFRMMSLYCRNENKYNLSLDWSFYQFIWYSVYYLRYIQKNTLMLYNLHVYRLPWNILIAFKTFSSHIANEKCQH